MTLYLRITLLCLCLLFLPAAGWSQAAPPHGSAPAAEQPRGQQNPAPATEQPGAHKAEPSLGEQLAEAENGEPVEEDEHAALNYSPSVKWIGRVTGTSLRTAYWIARIANFLIITALVVWIWRAQLPQAFRARSASIRKGIEEARRASEDANRRLADIEGRLGRLDGEIAQIRASAESHGSAEEDRIHAAAEEDRRKIVTAAEQEIEAATRQARRDLKAYAAELVVTLAEKRIQVDPSADRALVETFVEQLDGASSSVERRS